MSETIYGNIIPNDLKINLYDKIKLFGDASWFSLNIKPKITIEFIDKVEHLNMYHIKLFSISIGDMYCYIYRTHKYEPKLILNKVITSTIEYKDISFTFKIDDILYSISFDKHNKYILIKFYTSGFVFNVYRLSVKDNLDLLRLLFRIPIIVRYEDPSDDIIDNIILKSTLTSTSININLVDSYYNFGECVRTFRY